MNIKIKAGKVYNKIVAQKRQLELRFQETLSPIRTELSIKEQQFVKVKKERENFNKEKPKEKIKIFSKEKKYKQLEARISQLKSCENKLKLKYKDDTHKLKLAEQDLLKIIEKPVSNLIRNNNKSLLEKANSIVDALKIKDRKIKPLFNSKIVWMRKIDVTKATKASVNYYPLNLEEKGIGNLKELEGEMTMRLKNKENPKKIKKRYNEVIAYVEKRAIGKEYKAYILDKKLRMKKLDEVWSDLGMRHMSILEKEKQFKDKWSLDCASDYSYTLSSKEEKVSFSSKQAAYVCQYVIQRWGKGINDGIANKEKRKLEAAEEEVKKLLEKIEALKVKEAELSKQQNKQEQKDKKESKKKSPALLLQRCRKAMESSRKKLEDCQKRIEKLKNAPQDKLGGIMLGVLLTADGTCYISISGNDKQIDPVKETDLSFNALGLNPSKVKFVSGNGVLVLTESIKGKDGKEQIKRYVMIGDKKFYLDSSHVGVGACSAPKLWVYAVNHGRVPLSFSEFFTNPTYVPPIPNEEGIKEKDLQKMKTANEARKGKQIESCQKCHSLLPQLIEATLHLYDKKDTDPDSVKTKLLDQLKGEQHWVLNIDKSEQAIDNFKLWQSIVEGVKIKQQLFNKRGLSDFPSIEKWSSKLPQEIFSDGQKIIDYLTKIVDIGRGVGVSVLVDEGFIMKGRNTLRKITSEIMTLCNKKGSNDKDKEKAHQKLYKEVKKFKINTQIELKEKEFLNKKSYLKIKKCIKDHFDNKKDQALEKQNVIMLDEKHPEALYLHTLTEQAGQLIKSITREQRINA